MKEVTFYYCYQLNYIIFKDPEELLETLFNFLTPKDPFLKYNLFQFSYNYFAFSTFHLKNNVIQSCFLTQLFYAQRERESNPIHIHDILDWTFLESDILIDKVTPNLYF